MAKRDGQALANIVAANKARAGIPHTEEHKAKIRAACNTEEVRQRISSKRQGQPSSFKGKTHSDEARTKQREAKLGKHLSEEHKSKIGASVRALGEEWLEKLRQRPVYNPLPLTDDARARIVAANKRRTGIAHTEQHKAKIRRAAQAEEARQRSALAAAKQAAQWPKPRTCLEEQLAKYLSRCGFEFQEQKRFGRYVVDAFVPSLNVAYEADGNRWHQDKERQVKRDEYLIDYGLFDVIHYTENELMAMSL